MALEFPTSPSNGQQYTDGNGITWEYTTATTSWTPVTILEQGIVGATTVNYAAVSLTGTNIDADVGALFYKTITTNTTFTFATVESGRLVEFRLELTNAGAHTITWPASVKWEMNQAPTLTSSGTDFLGFMTRDGGTTWHGFVISYNSY